MQFSLVIIFALAISAISGDYVGLNASTIYVTEIHTAFTTVCSTSTQFVYNDITYIANKSTTLTVTNCPCTVIKPIITTSSVYCSTCYIASSSIPVYSNSSQTKPIGSGAITVTSTGTPSYITPTHVTSSASIVLIKSGTWILGILFLISLMKI